MRFIASVVHPTDFSPASQRAFAHAMAVALIRRASLTLLHVSSDGTGEWSGFPAVRETLERWHLLEPGSTRADVSTAVGVKVTKVNLSSRSPVSAVTDYVHRKPTDLLVVATEQREGLARFLHGSTAEAMARRSRTMTLFVPADARRSLVSLDDGSLTLHNILIPVDHAPDPGTAFEFARRVAGIAAGGQVTITLLHVGAAMPDVPFADGPAWKVVRMQRDGDPVNQIVDTADALKAELIVMPTAGRAGVFEALRGSTTERVLRHASCPLLAVPAAAARESRSPRARAGTKLMAST
jgi:nucleotide-binding universal stress UspA family protein